MIEAKNLTKQFDGFTALNHVSCRISRGSIYGMVGSNGAGKSTFLRIITGIYRQDAGSVEIDGAPVFDNPAVKSRLLLIPDELFFLPGASMNRMADCYRAFYPSFDRKRFEHLTKRFKLDPGKPIRGFSKGMRRQAAIILALSCRPDYYFFDETFDGLDPVMRNLVKGLICEDVADRNAAAIITSHSLRELENLCDQLALLHEGGILLQSDVENLKTSLFKVQVAFSRPFGKELFAGLSYLQYEQSGSVANLIVRGAQEETLAFLRRLTPVLLDVVPLSLEEVFLYEMRGIGYTFDEILEEEEEADEKESI